MQDREAAMAHFRRGSTRVLVTGTQNVRGIDVPSCALIINAQLPSDAAEYVCRAGRAGRFGRRALVISLVSRSQLPKLTLLQGDCGIDIAPLPEDFTDQFLEEKL